MTQAVQDHGRGTIIVADDHPLFRGALKQALSGIFAELSVIEAGTLEETVQALSGQGDIDLVLLDLKMPGVSGFSGLTFLRSQHPAVPIIVVSGVDDSATIRTCMEFGAAGYIPKTTPIEVMNKAIRMVLTGGTWTPPDIPLGELADKETGDLIRRLASLTPQQMRVLTMLSEGLLNKQIAYELSVSEATVKAHVSAILMKLGVESRTQAVIAASKLDIPG
ncbi:response regulator transcription factor [Rhabdaerophilum sp. SD176]|uniref:response regulator n=1 Tax=Rhabdaerophilum sp. SD176 TaxID=2983548 RepID=UPI0024DFC4C3|nr:response regulator transcription factor [Rhabdaerophilum sp. SD176]